VKIVFKSHGSDAPIAIRSRIWPGDDAPADLDLSKTSAN
jgi:hypothetical protein